MKIIRNGLCYVTLNDLIRYPIPEYLVINKDLYSNNELLVVDDLNSIEYIKNRQDIINYDDVCMLSDSELNLKIEQVYKILNAYAKRYLDTSKELRRNLYMKDKKVYRFHEYIYYGLLDYRNNREKIDEFINGQVPGMNPRVLKKSK